MKTPVMLTVAVVVGLFVTSLLLNFYGDVDAGGTASENGDSNGDGARNIADPVYLLNWLFASGPAPVPIATTDCSAEDFDGDTVPNGEDNCPDTGGPDQTDTDMDGVGDLCDICSLGDDGVDTDNDGTPDACDNCPATRSLNMADGDGDGVGDVCDNCPSTGNGDQADGDGDTVGDACDACPGLDDGVDSDNDGVPDGCDNCPNIGSADQSDFDQDGRGDVCDNCQQVDNANQEDSDGDGIGDICEGGVSAVFVGALTARNGRFTYVDAVGIPAANQECADNYPGSISCSSEQLLAAEAAGELVNATDTTGTGVTSFWYDDRNAPDNLRCVFDIGENIPWSYSTAHRPFDGQFADLNPDTGELGPPQVQFRCGGTHAVSCCNP